MTLDEFQKEIANCFQQLKNDMIIVLTKGSEAKLDENLMIAIVNNEIEKMGLGE